jgi:PAS domain S-box-containing protein
MLSILYVDDEPGLLEIGQLFLETTGEFTVRTVQSGREALDLLSCTDFDAVISDYQMPEMDGIELLKRVRQSYGGLPFILFTGKGREEIVIEAINNGVDSYLQKGGDPKAQFAELAHRVRQAISRRRAEIALSDSERRLADIINFLPDATFAIDTERYVIAWNHAIEEMTGIPAGEMLGKGEYEYAVAFYGSRRPILIDLVFEPDEKIADYYVNIQRAGNTISAETSLPHPKGKRIDVLAKASPLYNREGKITGAIEAIRDISDRKRSEEELRAANEQLAASGEELQAQFNELAESEKGMRESEARLSYMIGFYERAHKTEKDLLDYALEGAGIVTGSPLGYLAFLNAEESELTMYAWSKTAMDECTLRDKPLVYKTGTTGLWGEPVRQRQPVITNNYDAPDPAKKGYPEGHPRIIRHMGIPVIEDGHIVLIAGVANKSSGYTEHDADELVLLMQGLWTILKRKRAEQTQRESEAKYRSLVEHVPVGMHFYELNPDGALIFTGANPGADQILGIENSRFVGKTIEEAFPGLAGTEVPSRYREAAAHGAVWQTEQVDYEGQRIRGAFSVTAFPIAEGSMVAMFTDITRRKQTERELQAAYEQISASEEELREQYDELSSAQGEIQARKQQMEEIAATVPGVVYQFSAKPDGSTSINYVSARSEEIFGFDHSTADYLRWFTDHLFQEDRERFTASVEDAVRAGTRWEFEGRFVRPSGEMIWFRGISSPVRHGDELVYSGVLLDITERKHTEEAMHESELKYRMLVESSNDIIYTISADGILTFVSPSWTTLLGYPTQEVIGRSFRQFVYPEDIPACEAFLAKVVRTGERQTGIVYRVLHANGSVRIYTTNISPVLDDAGTLISYIGNAQDITDMKRSENAIRESNRKLNLLNSITRHDLANQLTVVQGYTQLALLRKPDPVTAEFIAKIDVAAGAMQRQIEFTRNYQELGVQAPAWYTINEIVMAVKPPNIALTCTCISVDVFADPMIGKVFFNLFDNAIRHGGKVTAITVQCSVSSDELVITVADNGVGISLDEKPKIFRKGYGKHTGFGLFLVREILAITGIFIHETGVHGKGARFEIAIPKGAYRITSGSGGNETGETH